MTGADFSSSFALIFFLQEVSKFFLSAGSTVVLHDRVLHAVHHPVVGLVGGAVPVGADAPLSVLAFG